MADKFPMLNFDFLKGEMNCTVYIGGCPKADLGCQRQDTNQKAECPIMNGEGIFSFEF
jgi:hypothetical protein